MTLLYCISVYFYIWRRVAYTGIDTNTECGYACVILLRKEGMVSNIFITSDLHFGHKNILKYSPETRPWPNVEEMNEALIEHWNNVVGPSDSIYHLGDFSFMNKEETEAIMKRLNGVFHFVIGNHDVVLGKLDDNVVRKRIVYEGSLKEMKHNGKHTVLCHYPLAVWNKSHYGSIMLHGHSHGSYKAPGRIMDVGWDAHGRILSLDEAVEMCLNKPIHYGDGHEGGRK